MITDWSRLPGLSLWQLAKSGSGQVAVLTGEAGIGKSRLSVELMDRVGVEDHTRLRYFCSEHLDKSPLHPFIEQLERASGFSPGDTPELFRLCSG